MGKTCPYKESPAKLSLRIHGNKVEAEWEETVQGRERGESGGGSRLWSVGQKTSLGAK